MTIATTLFSPLQATAGISLPAIISDHMVLQRSVKVPIWGKADPDGEISISLGDQTVGTKAGQDGKWEVEFNLNDVGPGPFDLVITGSNSRLVVSDVLIGEVWVASGQSNMELKLKDTARAQEEIARSGNALLRYFQVKDVASQEPLDDCKGQWVLSGPDTSGTFSAVGYYFGKRLQATLRAPVGIINASWGATPAEAWTSARSLDEVPDLKRARGRLWRRTLPLGHIPEPKATVPIFSSQLLPPQKVAGYLFNGMINPIIPYAMRGVIWYQGEGNIERAFQYRTTFALLIKDWRQRWGRGEFPFYFCQLANFGKKDSGPGESAWAELREAQSLALSLPNTGQAVLIDLGEGDNIHPLDKRDPAERLVLIALAKTYGKKIPFSGPTYDSMTVEGGTIRITFRDTGGALVARQLPSTYDLNTHKNQIAALARNSPDSELEGFAICGKDGRWLWADAKIEGDSVVVWSNQIARPFAVRYAWADNPTCNLYNAAGLPASPFRTDAFPLITRDNKY
jgi:sialate O-acetylesterase